MKRRDTNGRPPFATFIAQKFAAFVVGALLGAAALCTVPSLPAAAGSAPHTDSGIADKMIREKNAALSRVLNMGQHKKTAAIHFLHNHISDDARFTLSVDNPSLPAAHAGRAFEMGKTDYINTYIQGANMIDRYRFSIKTLETRFLPENGEALSRDVITERGVMMNPFNLSAPGRPFVSRTECTVRHAVRHGRLVTKGGRCHTDVRFERAI